MPPRGERGVAVEQRRTRPRPTTRGWLFLLSSVALFALARIFTLRELVFAGCLLLITPLLGLALVALRRPQLAVVRRTDPEIIEAGEPARVELEFSNRSGLATPAARWTDPIDGASGPGMPAALPTIPGFRRTVMQSPPTAQVGYDLAAPVRGVHAFGPVSVTVTDPFGTAVQTLAYGEPESVTITPRVWPLIRTATELVPGLGSDKYAGRLGPSGEVDVLARKYQTGDSMRRVNWPATARHGELMVRQDDQHGAKDATVILDTDPASYPGTRPDLDRQDDIEWAISAACSVAVHVLGDGYTLAYAASFGAAGRGRRTVRIYGPGDDTTLLLDAATVQRAAPDPGEDLVGLVELAGGAAAGRTILAVLGAASRPELLPDVSAGSALAIVVVPAHSAEGSRSALRLGGALEQAGWRVRLATAGESFTGIWQDLVGRAAHV